MCPDVRSMRECQVCKNCFTDAIDKCPNDGMPTTHTIDGEPVLEGKYHLEMRLGQGGMGVVYKARHAYLKTLLAIKIILPDLVGNDPQLVTRFRQEALAAAAIRHQNVVSVTDYGVINGTVPFLVMEYVEGESLHDLLAREKKLAPERALQLMSAICAGVGAAHHQGIVHRDLKPLNIMICSDKPNLSQAVKILDFGLAKIKSGELLGSFIQAQTTGLMGSPYYMAPEQWADEDPDSRADIYSLGVMLYQMLAGDVPFKGSSIPAIMKKHISDPPPPFAELGTAVSPELEAAVFHTLQKDPNKRSASVEIVVDELSRAIQPLGAAQATASYALPVSSLSIKTRPPGSRVFVDNVSVGESPHDGKLTLEGVQSGNHFLRVSHDGFDDWVENVVCDGSPQEIVAELREIKVDVNAIPMPDIPTSLDTVAAISFSGTAHPVTSPDAKTIFQSQPVVPVEPSAAARPKPKSKAPIIIGILGVFGLFVISGIGIGAAYFLGFFGSAGTKTSNANASSSPSPGASPAGSFKPEMILIPGGSFKMGRNNGQPEERPEHRVDVRSFRMEKTEVTNAEYYEFVKQTSRRPVPVDWVNDKPVDGKEMQPVRFVSLEDARAFAEWRSKRDGVDYRLPTEEEWEYAARNGSDGDAYPWGSAFRPECAFVDQPTTEPTTVGTRSCPNKWGVVDLIGNVYEWTASKTVGYPGGPVTTNDASAGFYAIRGGGAFTKSSGNTPVSSFSRFNVDPSKRINELGFRLVRNE